MPSEIVEEPNGFVPPRNETERKIARLWEETLNLERVGVRDNFLDLGGHSLHAMRVMNGIRSAWSLQLSIEQVLEHQTVEALAQLVDERVASTDEWRAPGASSQSSARITGM